MEQNIIPKFFWMWLPIGVLVIQLIMDDLLPQDIKAWLYNENGPYEILQFLILLCGVCVSAKILLEMDRTNKWLTAWISTALFCCVYVAGEEISWGQQFVGWVTPDHWMDVNDQGETNLHNTSSWLDQKPRLILEMGIYVGGIIIPSLLKFKPSILPVRFNIIYPANILSVTAACCLTIRVVDMIGDAFHHPVFGRASELEETFLFYFVFLYLLLMKDRLVGSKGA